MLIIELGALTQGVHQLSYSPKPSDVDLDPEVFSEVAVEVVLDYQKERALVTLEAHATAHLTCDRTLKPFDQEVHGSYSILYATRREATPGFEAKDSEEPYEEIRELDLTDLRLDITEAVRDTLVLALPQRRVAPGAEDIELQTQYGDGEEPGEQIDPRWEALRKLRSDESDE